MISKTEEIHVLYPSGDTFAFGVVRDGAYRVPEFSVQGLAEMYTDAIYYFVEAPS